MTNETSKEPITLIKSPPEPVSGHGEKGKGGSKPPGLFKTLFGRNKEIPEYGLLYFDHLKAEYQFLKVDLEPEEIAICNEILAKRDDRKLTWHEVYTFQTILLKHQDFETIKNRIISLRIKFQNLADANEYADYLTFRAVDLKNLDEAALLGQDLKKPLPEMEKLRADLRYLLDEFYMRYAFIAARESLRAKLMRNVSIYTLFFAIFAVSFFVWIFIPAKDTTNPIINALFPFTTLIAVVFAGVIGAFVSMQERLQNTQLKGDPIYNLSLLWHGWLSIMLSPISGAIFAVLLFLFFAGKFITGALIPTIAEGPLDSYKIGETSYLYMSLKTFILGAYPATSKDYALLMVWSFVAGFAERFVPDTLMRVVNTKKTGDNPAA